MAAETNDARAQRRQWRALFDGVADRYQASRRGYPPGLVEFMAGTAGLVPGSRVLEVGCGTGQLTGQLAAAGLAVTAIDIGAWMIEAARLRAGSPRVSFEVVSFEGFAAADACFNLVASATAFHWIDPEVRFAKAARLLKPGGWLALLGTAERYDDPFGTALRRMWLARSSDGAWAGQDAPPETDLTGAARWFGPPVRRSHSEPIVLPAETVIAVETTRATFLAWPGHLQRDFTAVLRSHLRGRDEVRLTQQASLAMAQVLAST